MGSRVTRQRVSQDPVASERMPFAPACWENENRREGTAPLGWGLVLPGGGSSPSRQRYGADSLVSGW